MIVFQFRVSERREVMLIGQPGESGFRSKKGCDEKLCPGGDSQTLAGAQAAGGHSLLPSVAASVASSCDDRLSVATFFCSFSTPIAW